MWMTEGQIVSDYRQAKDPEKQIKVLAELNAVKPAVIKDVLIKHGEIRPEKEKEKMATAKWTSDDVSFMLEKKKLGLTAEQIAQKMGRTKGAIYAKLKELRDKGKEIAAEIEAEAVVHTEGRVAVCEQRIEEPTRSIAEEIASLAKDYTKIEGLFGKSDRVFVHAAEWGASLNVIYGDTVIRIERLSKVHAE
jgi:hypothetical protein